MALLTCPECKGKVSSSVSVCPHCGYDMAATRIIKQKDTVRGHSSVSPGMIGLIIALSLLLGGLLFMLFTRNSGDNKSIEENKSITVTDEPSETRAATTSKPIRIGKSSIQFTGTLGGDNNSWLRLDGEQGRYKFTSYQRDVRLTSYDPSSGKLQLEAVSNNNGYIGTFSGTLQSEGEDWIYSGTFTNLNNISISFRFTGQPR